MKTNFKLVVLTVTFLVTSLACANITSDRASSDDYISNLQTLHENLSGIDRVVVENVNGSIKAAISSSDSMVLKVEERVRIQSKIDPKSLIEETKVVAERRGNELRVHIDYGKYKDHKHRHYYQSNYTLTLPKRLSVSFSSSNGSVTAPAFDGKVELNTTNGSIQSAGAGHGASLDTTNGSIHINAIIGNVEADTTNGSIYIEGAAGEVEAATTNGDIEVHLKEQLSGDITCSTTNGSIKFFVPTGSSYTVEADTSWGKIHGSDELKYNKRRNTASGSIGGGKYRVELDTTNGSIYIK